MFFRAAHLVMCSSSSGGAPRLSLGLMRELTSLDINHKNILAEIEASPFSSESLLKLNEKLQVNIKDFSNPELHEVVEILHDKNVETFYKDKVSSTELIISTVR